MSDSGDMKISERSYRVYSVELPADLETPVSAFLKLRKIGATFLLESAESVDRLGRFSFLGFASERSLTADGAKTVYRESSGEQASGSDPLDVLKAVLGATKIAESAPSLLGAAVGYIGYDYARFIEELPSKHPRDEGMPVCEFSFVESLVVFDHYLRNMTVYSLVPEGEGEPAAFHEDILKALETPLARKLISKGRAEVAFESNTSKDEYEEIVSKARKHIYDGDCFQIVLSRCLKTECPLDSFEIYRRLRMANPSPYMFYLDFGRRRVIGSSPEMMVKLNGRKALISPIAGTRPRGKEPKEDRALEAELLADEKERAEHTMLVDLARNDLGRVCSYGTVKVEEFMRIERYSHVMHIVSDVEGELRDGCDQFDLFRASFPAGTVSGAPKVRAMEIIEDLEKAQRGVYAGAVGYFSVSGDMDTCIAIRMMQTDGDTAYLQAGAGIVADSDPEREYIETDNKLAVLKEAVESAMEDAK